MSRKRFALLGHPVAHSLSPAMHNAAFKRLRIDAAYELWDVVPEDLPAALERARKELDGFNITVPHKPAVFEAADDVHEVGNQVGAINTIRVQQGRLRGRNTDVYGLQRAWADERFTVENKRVVVLGSGGAARACVVAAARARASDIRVAARDVEAAKRIGNEMRLLFGNHCQIEASSLEDVGIFEAASLVLQATSAELIDPEGADAFAASLPIHALPDDAAVFDLIYKPAQTAVMKHAEARGLRVANGLGMLLHQGAAAFEWWTGELAPIDFMRATLYEAVSSSLK